MVGVGRPDPAGLTCDAGALFVALCADGNDDRWIIELVRGVTRGGGGVCAIACDVMHGTRDVKPRDGVAMPLL